MEVLPNEIILKIIKMAANKATRLQGYKYSHYFLIHVIGKISTRFKRVSRMPELWRENVMISMGTDTLEQSVEYEDIKEVIGSDIVKLGIHGNHTVDILDLNDRCQNLEKLWMKGLRTDQWIFLPSPWTSIKRLAIVVADTLFENTLFEGIEELHQVLPNLVAIRISAPDTIPKQIKLPSMGQCEKLRTVTLSNGVFSLPDYTVPLPLGLRSFRVSRVILARWNQYLSEDAFVFYWIRYFNGTACRIRCIKYGVLDVFGDLNPNPCSDSEEEQDDENADQNHIPQKRLKVDSTVGDS